MRRRENNNFIDLRSSSQALLSIRSYIYTSFNNDSRLEINSYLLVWGGIGVTDTMDQCLIKIKYNNLLLIILPRELDSLKGHHVW